MAEPAPGRKVGEYILEEEVGQGTFGTVWRARHAVLGTVAAIKIPTDPDYIRNLRTEGVIQHQIDNPHVVKTLGIDPWHDPPYLAVEYVEGESLRTLLRDEMPLAVGTALNYATQILEALQAAHEASVIHRDLKPENILVGDDGVVKVTDFGLGRVEEATTSSILASGSLHTSAGGDIAGTIEYMAPEQRRAGGKIDRRADIYAFGVVLFEMLTGTRPTGSDLPSELDSSIPVHLDTLFRGCFCRLNKRFASAKDILSAVEVGAVPERTQSPKAEALSQAGPEVTVLTGESRKTQREIGIDLGGGVTMEMVPIPAGTFIMGSPTSEEGRADDETQHEVTISKAFYMGATEVTQGQWEVVMGFSPSRFEGRYLPVETVSWEECQRFISKLNAKVRGGGFRLPTEAEWEYACRAGTTTRFHSGGADGDLAAAGWCGANSDGKTHRVGGKKPNAWGLRDMHGNVWEWCSNWYEKEYPRGKVTDPAGPETGTSRVVRGGSWYDVPRFCRSAIRSSSSPSFRVSYVGFRFVRTVITP